MSFPQHFCNFYLAKSKKKGSVVRTSGKLDLSLADGILDLKPVEKNMETCVNKFTDEMKHRLTLKLTDGMDFFFNLQQAVAQNQHQNINPSRPVHF